MPILRSILSLLLLAAIPVAAAPATTVLGRVVGVTDGDTLTLLTPEKVRIKVRLAGIDAPEGRQAFGNKAKQALSGKVFGQNVRLLVTDRDRYGRSVGEVYLQNRWINLELVSEGWAWHYVKYSDSADLAAAQAAARAARRGLWADPHPIAPWLYRHGKKTE